MHEFLIAHCLNCPDIPVNVQTLAMSVAADFDCEANEVHDLEVQGNLSADILVNNTHSDDVASLSGAAGAAFDTSSDLALQLFRTIVRTQFACYLDIRGDVLEGCGDIFLSEFIYDFCLRVSVRTDIIRVGLQLSVAHDVAAKLLFLAAAPMNNRLRDQPSAAVCEQVYSVMLDIHVSRFVREYRSRTGISCEVDETSVEKGVLLEGLIARHHVTADVVH
jgi:hypothetical protein